MHSAKDGMKAAVASGAMLLLSDFHSPILGLLQERLGAGSLTSDVLLRLCMVFFDYLNMRQENANILVWKGIQSSDGRAI